MIKLVAGGHLRTLNVDVIKCPIAIHSKHYNITFISTIFY